MEVVKDAGGEYIRPIVLFQAQPNTNEESEIFDIIKKLLMDMGIPEEKIRIKTSKVDDISRLDLMSSDCPIRYIITVNALKEGWDFTFWHLWPIRHPRWMWSRFWVGYSGSRTRKDMQGHF